MAVTYISSDTLIGIRTPLCRTSLPPAEHEAHCYATTRYGQPATHT